MGRRALRKIAPDLDLSWHFIPFEELAVPFDPQSLFPRPAPLVIEVGCGKGLFMQVESAAHPEKNYLGIEIRRKYAKFTAAKLARAESTNARMIHGNGELLFQNYLADESVSEVHVYFPDPWWKKRHHKRRILNEHFLRDVYRVLSVGGHLHFWTDVEDYFNATLELIAEQIPLVGPEPVAATEATELEDFRTHFERRTRLHGEAVYRSRFTKLAPGSPDDTIG